MARRQSILDAALDAFLAKGFEATTLEDIRARSGASTGSIYHLFRGKEHIAGVLFAESLRSYQSGQIEAIRAGATAEEAVKAAVTYYLRWVEAQPDLARFLLVTPKSKLESAVRDELLAMNRAFLRAIGEAVAGFVRAGALRRLSPDLFSALVMGPSHEFARSWLAGTARATMDEAVPVLADAAYRAVAVTPGSPADRRAT